MALYFNTVSLLLKTLLEDLMQAAEFQDFRLVGGTALSLYYGHRMSVDIDLFTDAEYNSIDFKAIDAYLKANYPYVDSLNIEPVGMGKGYYVGNSAGDSVKIDLFYTDDFIEEYEDHDGLRLASRAEIAAMKLDVVRRTGRKKDFWDIDCLSEDFTINEMFELHEKRYPFEHERDVLIKKFSDFSHADDDFDPVCLREKHWQIIKLNMIELVGKLE